MPRPRSTARLSRPATALGAAALLLTLTGCEKPAPVISVQAGDAFVASEAATWAHEVGDAPRTYRTTPKTLEFTLGERLGIDVGAALSDRGWYFTATDLAASGSQPVVSQPRDDHHFSYFPDRATRLQVFALNGTKGPDGRYDLRAVTGSWEFTLLPEGSLSDGS